MYINITKSETGNNKGSCSRLVDYLEKENLAVEKMQAYNRMEYWFNHEKTDIRPYEVRRSIDENIAKLSRDEAKFFLINISPSEQELLFLKDEYGDDGAKVELKRYANKVMDAYAKNFFRDRINSHADLVYFGKLEQYRYYTFKDAEVKMGNVKKGDVKPGEQMHIQIIVSRKDATNSIKLSPLNNSRGKNKVHSQQVGQFDRVAFKEAAEALFDSIFTYDRKVMESFYYANTLKHGSLEKIAEVKEFGGERFNQVAGTKGLLEVLLEPAYQENATKQFDLKKRRRKRRLPGR